MKAINKTYNLDDERVSVEWDLADDNGDIVVPELVTTIDLGDKADLTNAINKILREYEAQ